ncbi:MAG: PIG-L family deacetylase [Chloroflexi bacterium]|nr:PIG-L family deacetylase [Chloroflexota bacterium]
MKLLCVLAHPDDESLGTGGALAKYAAEGIDTYLITATRGEHGWWGTDEDYPGPIALGQIREAELRSAAEVLRLREVHCLDYEDGELDRAEPRAAVAQLVDHFRRIRPDVVVTFGPDGAYGHPDHIAISQFTAAAIVCAADPGYSIAGLTPWRASKFYYRVWTQSEFDVYQAVFGEQLMTIDGVDRRPVPWHAWAITTRLYTAAYWPSVWQAVACHRSQLPGYQRLKDLPPDHHRALWGSQGFYRVYSAVNGGRAIESDLFAGLR